MQNKIRKIHMVGIGGVGMSGIAEVLLNLGYKVSGSDIAENAIVKRLKNLGAKIYLGHFEENIDDEIQVVVRTSAVNDENPELVAAKRKSIPIIPRAEMLAELMRLKTGIAIAGTHGKTTTTSLTAAIFDEAGFDPTVIIGGILNAYGTNARLGQSEYLIAEADESDGSFLCLLPIINVVTNVDLDHVDFYDNLQNVDQSFINFMNKVPFYGANIVCIDDLGIKRILPYVKRPIITYGFSPEAMFRAEIVECAKTNIFKLFYKVNIKDNEICLGEFKLAQPGQHNILNACAAIAVGIEMGIDLDKCKSGLAKFSGVGRRFEYKGQYKNIDIIDDYGHHPAEIIATIKTAQRVYPDKRIVVAFQPHRFSRTQALFGDFCNAFHGVGRLLLAEIYPASEKPIPGVNSQNLAQGIMQVSKVEVSFHQNLDEIVEVLKNELQENDILISLGAGNITNLAGKLLE